MSNFLEISIPSLSVRRFYVREALSRPFEIGLVTRSHDHNIDLDKVTGQPASFKIHTGYAGASAPTRLWSGVVSHFEQVQIETSATGESTYFVRIVPNLWL